MIRFDLQNKKHNVTILCRACYAIFIVSFFFGCCSTQEGKKEYFLVEGEVYKQQLIEQLVEIHSLQDLLISKKKCSLLFDSIAALAIEARRYQIKHHVSWEVPEESEHTSSLLCAQMKRVLQIPGALACLEGCQAKAFEKIYAFEEEILS